MAGFRTHVTTSSVLGIGYAGVLHTMYGVPMPTATVAGALCGFSGMLPDLDSDYGVPLREAMSFAAATIPVFLVNRFESLQLSRESIIIIAIGLYLFVRFGIGTMIRKFTVHRGMFHSIPAMLIFGGITYLLTSSFPTNERFMMAGGVMGGFLSHLILDEIYAVEFKGGRWRTKKSFGTALKLWGGDGRSNFAAYSKLAIVGMGVIGEPSMLKQFIGNQPLASKVNDAINIISNITKDQPQFADQFNQIKNVLSALNNNTNAPPQNNWSNGPNIATAPQNNQYPYQPPSNANWNQNQYPTYAAASQQAVPTAQTQSPNNQPSNWQWPVANQSYNSDGQAQAFQNGYDTAQRPVPSYSQ